MGVFERDNIRQHCAAALAARRCLQGGRSRAPDAARPAPQFWKPGEWLELPAGVVAQIMGHKPSATSERHYRVRPLDLLCVHHERLEAWILEQAGVQFDATAEPGKLRAVATS